MKANEGCYITVARDVKDNWLITSKPEAETEMFLEVFDYKACVILNEATGSIVRTKGPISDKMWDIVSEIRYSIRNR